MPEQKMRFMEELDHWVETEIFAPLRSTWLAYKGAPEGPESTAKRSEIGEAETVIKKLVRQKVLESYRNGQQAGPRVVRQRQEGRSMNNGR